MSLFTIDAEKCKRDGICVAECPFGLLEMKNPEGNTNFGTIMIGHPKFKYYRMPFRNKADVAWL